MLELRDVTLFIGHGEDVRPLLSDVSARFPRGHFGAIIGPSGCGKSTLLKVITGIAHGDEEGQIHWDGRNLMEQDFSPSEIGYVPQFSIAHDELTVRECVAYAMKLRVRGMHGDPLDEAVARILDEVNMTEFSDRLVHVLSGGQRRRLALAMELASKPVMLLSLSLHVAEQTKKDLQAEGTPYVEHPAMGVVRQLCEIGRIGKKAGKGFYDWGDGERRLWPELTALYPPAARQPAQHELIDRLMFAQANEAARCLEEGVLRSVADGNIGSIFGWGFAPFQGGALQFINAMGAAAFVARARELAARHGARFEPAASVVALAATGGRFVDG